MSDKTCQNCLHPKCMQRTTSSNAWKHCYDHIDTKKDLNAPLVYHPVTREELEQIRSGCDATKMMDDVLSRPDPLALLKKWREWVYFNRAYPPTAEHIWRLETGLIYMVYTDPYAVRQQGIANGWWKE